MLVLLAKSKIMLQNLDLFIRRLVWRLEMAGAPATPT